MSQLQKALPVLIAAGASLSNGALPGDHTLVGIQMPSVWTAASLTFQISYDAGVSWHNLFDHTGTEVALSPTSPAGLYLAITLLPNPFNGIIALKVRSGTSAIPVNQVAQATLILVTRKLFPVG